MYGLSENKCYPPDQSQAMFPQPGLFSIKGRGYLRSAVAEAETVSTNRCHKFIIVSSKLKALRKAHQK